MLAYHNDTALKASAFAALAAHREADELIKGEYWENGKGCAVGCLIKSGDHMLYEDKFGIPVMLARFEDLIFERLPNARSQAWPERFMSAIEPGADLSKAGWQFLEWLLTVEIQVTGKGAALGEVRATIRQAADLLALLIAGEPGIPVIAPLMAQRPATLTPEAAKGLAVARASAQSALSSSDPAHSAELASRAAVCAAGVHGSYDITFWGRAAGRLVGLVKTAPRAAQSRDSGGHTRTVQCLLA